MFKMVSAELYKLRKSKSFWIMLAVVAGFSLFMSVIFGVMPAEDLMGLRPESASAMMIDALPMNMQAILFLLVVFIIILVSSDFEAGTIRNPLAVGVSRLEYFIGKFVVILIGCAVFVVTTVLATGLSYLLFEPWGDGFNLANLVASVGVGYLILVAQATLFMMVAMMTRKIGATLGIVIGYLVIDMIVSTVVVMVELSDVARVFTNIFPSSAAYYMVGLSAGTANFGNVMVVVGIFVVMIVVTALAAVGSLVRRDV